jgi:hypothetical protein
MSDHGSVANDAEAPPIRSAEHERLAVFLGQWEAEGTSYGGTDQTGDDHRANGVAWTSTHTGRWHTGEFFLLQDEQARPGGQVFDTISVMGVDPATGRYFCRSFENHGFFRDYDVAVDGYQWQITGPHERATITFSDDSRIQTHSWEWKPGAEWLPLCDRIARRVD